jgi:transposase
MRNILTDEQALELRLRHRTERDGRIRDRIKAVLLYDMGWSYEQIAEALFLSDEAIKKHIKDFEKAQKLKPANGGSQSKLSECQKLELSQHIDATGYTEAKEIRQYIESQYKVKYTLNGTIKLLHSLGFVYKKPKLVPGKLDNAKQEEFIKQYKELKAQLKETEALYFMDSVHPQYQARNRYGWILKGKDKTLPTNSGWKRMHIVGAIDINNLNVVQEDKPKINGDYIIEFLQKLEQENKDKSRIYLVCDNAGYHKAKKVKEYLISSKIELIFLPPYSPNLNPIERLWKLMHSVVTNNKYYCNFSEFTEAINDFFGNLTKYRSRIATLINDNFQTIKLDHFYNSSS